MGILSFNTTHISSIALPLVLLQRIVHRSVFVSKLNYVKRNFELPGNQRMITPHYKINLVAVFDFTLKLSSLMAVVGGADYMLMLCGSALQLRSDF